LDRKEFSSLRQRLRKTQREMAELLGTSLKAVQSFEQGWRKVPVHIERQALFLISTRRGGSRKSRPCWDVRGCSPEIRESCPAWEFNLGHLCWFVNGTICRGKTQGGWPQKMKVCRSCEVFAQTIKPGNLGKEGRFRAHREGKEGKGKNE
jgi:DNA-binding XRE family transcriptional regulator